MTVCRVCYPRNTGVHAVAASTPAPSRSQTAAAAASARAVAQNMLRVSPVVPNHLHLKHQREPRVACFVAAQPRASTKTSNSSTLNSLRNITHPGPRGATELKAAHLRTSTAAESTETDDSPKKTRRQRPRKADNPTWDLRFAELVAYHEHHGHCDVPSRYAPNPQLGNWVRRLRYDYSRGNVPLHQRLELAALGFKWTVGERSTDTLWEARFSELEAFQEEHGHCNVTPESHLHLYEWSNQQRQLSRNGRLPEAQSRRLTQLCLDWEAEGPKLTREERWCVMFDFLSRFVQDNGHCRVPRDYPQSPGLCRWVYQQRSAQRNGRLPQDRRDRLDSVGFDWGSAAAGGAPEGAAEEEKAWKERLRELEGLQGAREGPLPLSGCLGDAGSDLGSWLRRQGHLRRVGKLPGDKEAALEGLGVDWAEVDTGIASFQEQWDARFEALEEFGRRHGHCDVPSTYAEDPALARWCSWQRYTHMQGTMAKDREAQLNSLGFRWSTEKPSKEEAWALQLSRLVAFKEEHGHTRVPWGWEEDPSLAKWVGRQRDLRRAGRLLRGREEALEAVGFHWGAEEPQESPEELWGRRRAQLEAFWEAHGHTRVPQRWEENPALGRWVRTQRKKAAAGQMSEERRESLNRLSFEWRLK